MFRPCSRWSCGLLNVLARNFIAFFQNLPNEGERVPARGFCSDGNMLPSDEDAADTIHPPTYIPIHKVAFTVTTFYSAVNKTVPEGCDTSSMYACVGTHRLTYCKSVTPVPPINGVVVATFDIERLAEL